MSTLRLEEAIQLVLLYYSGNGYSKVRFSKAKRVLLQLEEALSQGTFSHNMESLETFIRQQGLTYNAYCDLRPFSSKVFVAMATGTIDCSNIRVPRPPSLSSVEYISELALTVIAQK